MAITLFESRSRRDAVGTLHSLAAHLAVVLEQLRNGGDDVGVVVAPLERVDALGAPLRPWRHADRLRPQNAAGRVLLRAT